MFLWRGLILNSAGRAKIKRREQNICRRDRTTDDRVRGHLLLISTCELRTANATCKAVRDFIRL